MADVIVIGAGMAGLTAARDLARAGLRVAVLEARQRLGGRIHTVRDFCGAPLEAGAELIHGKDAPTWPEVQAAGLTVRPCSHAITSLMMDIGHGTRWLPRELLHPQTWGSFGILRRLARREPRDLSAQEFIERSGYRGRARALAEMVFTSHLPGSTDEIGINGFAADGILRLEQGVDHRINEGHDRLVEHIGRGLDIEFGFLAQTIAWSPHEVVVGDDGGRERSGRAAISTLPPGVLQSEAVRFSPQLPESKLEALRGMVMGPVLKIILRFDQAFWPSRMSMLCSYDGPVTLYWNVFYRAARGEPVLTAYCTGRRAAALSRASEDEAVARVVEDLRGHFPRARLKLDAWRLFDWSADPLSRGGYTFLRPGGAESRDQLAAADTGALFWAGSETSTQPIAATVAAAYVSGQRAAAQVRAALRA